jgi:hypothetical protein
MTTSDAARADYCALSGQGAGQEVPLASRLTGGKGRRPAHPPTAAAATPRRGQRRPCLSASLHSLLHAADNPGRHGSRGG